MRVAHLTAWSSGGVWAAVKRLHQAMLQRGIDSQVHTIGNVPRDLPGVYAIPRKRKSVSDRIKRMIWGEENHLMREIKFLSETNPPYEAFTPPYRIWRYERPRWNGAVDIVHLHWCGGFIDLAELFDVCPQPIVWTLHDQNPYLGGFHYQSDSDTATSMKLLEQRCLEQRRTLYRQRPISVVANSRWNLAMCQQSQLFSPNSSSEFIALPVPLDDYRPTSKAVAKRSLQLDPTKYVIGFACESLENPRKGFMDLVAALQQLPREIQDSVQLLSFGKSPSEVIQQSISIPWVDLGRIDNTQQQALAYSAMDLFVAPSREEAYGQTPIEAALCETPTVASRTGGLTENILDQVTGRFAEPRSPQSLASTISELVQSPERSTEMGRQARLVACERHAPTRIVDQYLNTYERAMANVSLSRVA